LPPLKLQKVAISVPEQKDSPGLWFPSLKSGRDGLSCNWTYGMKKKTMVYADNGCLIFH